MKTKRKTGRPSSFNPDYCERAESLCLLGLKDTELAQHFGVTEKTLNNWKHEYPQFLQSLNAGRVCADSCVARSLYQKAIGGDTTACIFWLKNRRKLEWRDRHELDASVEVTHPLPDMSDEELLAVVQASRERENKR